MKLRLLHESSNVKNIWSLAPKQSINFQIFMFRNNCKGNHHVDKKGPINPFQS
jgi:hypothetical protein